jgi:hypothetical protein
MTGTMTSRTTATIPLLAHIIRTEGTAALFAGVLPRTAKIAPACGIMIACFEVCLLYAVETPNLPMYFRELVSFWRRRTKTSYLDLYYIHMEHHHHHHHHYLN